METITANVEQGFIKRRIMPQWCKQSNSYISTHPFELGDGEGQKNLNKS